MSIRVSDFAPNIKSERELLSLANEGSLDRGVLDIVLPNGEPREYETALWDYKRKLPNTLGKEINGADAPNEIEICELVKDVVAFYNSFGGYIIAGVGEYENEPICGCQNSERFAFRVEKLNEKLLAYTKVPIKCRVKKFDFAVGDSTKCVVLLHIPRRPPHSPVARFAKGAPEVKSKQIFKKGDIFARVDDKCMAARNNKSVIPFVCSARDLRHTTDDFMPADNNLPPRDPNLVRFVGRTEYLDQLWWWMVEQTVPLKVLTALGGTGKTSIAYEFCGQIVQNRPSWVEKVVWLSAKRQTYSAIQGKTYSASRVDFHDIDSFWRALAREVGVSDDVLVAADGTDEIAEEVLASIVELPCVIVVDDIDTLPLDQQSELFAQVQMIAGRASSTGSRFLITSRLEFGGMNQKINVEGFPKPEFDDYIKILVEQTNIAVKASLRDSLWRASLGSPIFAASIFRLARLGTPMATAIKSWKGKDGEDVRRFAFAREIEQLTDAECRTLYALITLGETTQLELTQILEIDQQELLRHLSTIREYHLFAANDASLRGAKLVVPAPILLMSDIVKEKITDPRRIERECARARNKTGREDGSVSFLIGQIVALWKEDNYEEAVEIAREAVKRNPKSSDLPCMLGRCLLKLDPSQPRDADKAFKAAFANGCTRIELAPLWIEAKRQLEDWVGISEISDTLPRSEIRGPAALISALAEANLGMQALGRADDTQAKRRFKQSMFEVQIAIQDGRADDNLPEMREVARESARRYVSIVDRTAVRAGDRIDVFNAVKDAFACHISEASLLLRGGTALHEWARDVFSREYYDRSAAQILDNRIRDLDNQIAHVENEPFDRTNLANTMSQISLRLKEDLSAYRATKDRG